MRLGEGCVQPIQSCCASPWQQLAHAHAGCTTSTPPATHPSAPLAPLLVAHLRAAGSGSQQLWLTLLRCCIPLSHTAAAWAGPRNGQAAARTQQAGAEWHCAAILPLCCTSSQALPAATPTQGQQCRAALRSHLQAKAKAHSASAHDKSHCTSVSYVHPSSPGRSASHTSCQPGGSGTGSSTPFMGIQFMSPAAGQWEGRAGMLRAASRAAAAPLQHRHQCIRFKPPAAERCGGHMARIP